MRRAALVAVIAATVLVPAGCGGGGGSSSVPTTGSATQIPGGARTADVQVIKAWVDALRHGDVAAAARYFAIPSVAENPPLLVHIRSFHDAVAFNQTLPCGARLIRAETAGRFTTATFRLTERPGPGTCGQGDGTTAQTAFVIRDGKIAEWRRIAPGGPHVPSNST